MWCFQLLAGVHDSAMVPPSPVSIAPSPSQCFAPTGLSVSTGYSMPINVVQPNIVSYAPPSVTRGTSYAGYGGIYPQATPLQQVALALRQAPASTAPAVLSTNLSASTTTKISSSTSAEPDKRPPQKRKFQELLVSAKGSTAPSQNSRQGSEFLKPGSEDSGVRSILSMPPPRKLVEPASCVMPPPPPPRNMPPHPSPRSMSPPPPKFVSPQSTPKIENSSLGLNDSMPPSLSARTAAEKSSSVQSPPTKPVTANTNGGPVSDTLLKLMEYGDEDDDVDDAEEFVKNSPVRKSVRKPFWAV